jgi:5,10-methylene-tetrahydrofolate dehydrogenase/methenyl tetrahydrofolate cyclohydrolase
MNAKTPYEIRLELLKMAQDQENAKFFNQWEQAARKAEINENATFLTEVPQFPTAENIITEANKLKSFVDKG